MKTWQRMPRRGFCGYCGRVLLEGEPVLLLVLTGLSGARPRCPACAGEPIDHAALVQQVREPPAERSTVRAFQRVGELARDVKLAAAGEREDGAA